MRWSWGWRSHRGHRAAARRLAALLGGTALAGVAVTAPVAAQAQAQQRSFNVPAQALPAAIASFGRQAGLHVAIAADSARGKQTRAVQGTYTTEQALQLMLAGTGLSFRFSGARTVTVFDGNVSAQATGPAGAIPLDPITVEGQNESPTGPVQGFVARRSLTGSKTDTPLIENPQSISVVPRGQMDVQGVQNMAQALRYTPSVTGELFGDDVRGYGLQLRGFNTWDQAFYRDGLQLRAPAFANFVPIDPYGAERIEVMRGPASVLYGQNDPGGIINYVSKRPLDTPFREIELGYGSFDNKQMRFDLSGPANPEKTLLYRLTGVVRGSGTHVDFVDHDRVFLQPSFTWKPDFDTTLTVLGHYQKDKTGWTLQFLPAYGTVFGNPNGRIPTSRFTGERNWDRFDLDTATIGYLFEHRVSEAWTVRQNVRYAHLENQQEGVFGLGFAPGDTRLLARYGDWGRTNISSVTADNHVQAKFATGPLAHTLLAGLDFQHHRFNDLGGGTNPIGDLDLYAPVYGTQSITPAGTPYTHSTTTQRQVGLYLQDQVKLDNWVLTLGGRQDWVETRVQNHLNGSITEPQDKAFTGRVGLTYLFDFGLAPYVSYAESFLPKLGLSASGTPFVPETGRQYEVGLKYQPPGWNAFVTVAAFDITRQNVATKDLANPAGNFQVQTGEVRSRGIEVEAVASLSFGLNLRGAYSYIDMEVTADNVLPIGSTPYGVPEHRAALWADYTLRSGALAGLGFGAGVRYVGPTWGDNINTFRIPGFTLADASIFYDWRQFRLAVNAQNVFDTVHVASCSGIEYCYYGAPRKVLATLRYRW